MKFRHEFPLPDTDWPPTHEFWAAAARGELAVPRCDACGRYVWYPDGTCRFCDSHASTSTTSPSTTTPRTTTTTTPSSKKKP